MNLEFGWILGGNIIASYKLQRMLKFVLHKQISPKSDVLRKELRHVLYVWCECMCETYLSRCNPSTPLG